MHKVCVECVCMHVFLFVSVSAHHTHTHTLSPSSLSGYRVPGRTASQKRGGVASERTDPVRRQHQARGVDGAAGAARYLLGHPTVPSQHAQAGALGAEAVQMNHHRSGLSVRGSGALGGGRAVGCRKLKRRLYNASRHGRCRGRQQAQEQKRMRMKSHCVTRRGDLSPLLSWRLGSLDSHHPLLPHGSVIRLVLVKSMQSTRGGRKILFF
jgi:hypothetical protein